MTDTRLETVLAWVEKFPKDKQDEILKLFAHLVEKATTMSREDFTAYLQELKDKEK